MLFLLFSYFFGLSLSITCLSGTSVSSFSCTANTSNGESCITGQLVTLRANPLSGTTVYACGNCSYYNSTIPMLQNISCCNTDNCAVLVPPTPGSCDSISSFDSVCNNRTDCYWCEGSFVGVGICKDLSTLPLPCWAIPVLMPSPICSKVICSPVQNLGITPYNYTNQIFSRTALTKFGLPPVVGNQTVAIALGLDLLTSQVRYLNDTYEFCKIAVDLQEWCGINQSSWGKNWRYCIVSETWPQPDMWGWLENTTFTSPGSLTVLRPSICACPNPKRAYYIPVRSVHADQFFSPACTNEHPMVAFFVLLLLITTIALIVVIYDTIILFLKLTERKKGLSSGSKTLAVKIVAIIYFLVTIPDQAILFTPYNNGTQVVVSLMLRLIGIIAILFCHAMASFTFVQMILESNVFGENKAVLSFLKVFRWIFLAFNSFLLFGVLGVTCAFGYYTQRLYDQDLDSINTFTFYYQMCGHLAKTLTLTLISIQAILIVTVLILLFYISFLIKKNVEDMRTQKHIRNIVARLAGLFIASFFAIPNLAIYCAVGWYVGWINTNSIAPPFPGKYYVNQSFIWFFWAEFVTELLWICAICYAMRTKVKASFIYKALLSSFRGSTDTGSGTGMTGGSSTNSGSFGHSDVNSTL